MEDVPIYDSEYGFMYIRTSELSDIEREFFEHWLFGQTRPLIEGIEPQDAAYLYDYKRYKSNRGRPDSLAEWD